MYKRQNIASDAPFDAAQKELVAFVAAAMIPADASRNMPAADHPHILRDILQTAVAAELAAICAYVNRLAHNVLGCDFAQANFDQKNELANNLAGSNAPEVRGFVSLVVQCYFRDDRVLGALGLEARAPFPKGHDVPAGEWDLLETVKRRQPFYRVVDR